MNNPTQNYSSSAIKNKDKTNPKPKGKLTKPTRKISLVANALQSKIAGSFGSNLKLESASYYISSSEKVSAFGFLRASINFMAERIRKKKGQWPRHIIVLQRPSLISKQNKHKEMHFAQIMSNILKHIVCETRILAYKLWDLRDRKVCTDLKKKFKQIGSSQDNDINSPQKQEALERHVKTFMSSLYKKEMDMVGLQESKMVIEEVPMKRACLSTLCESPERSEELKEKKEGLKGETNATRQLNKIISRPFLANQLTTELKKIILKEKGIELKLSGKTTEENATSGGLEVEHSPRIISEEHDQYLSLKKAKMRLRQKRSREDIQESIQKDLGQWFTKEMTMEQLPVLDLKFIQQNPLYLFLSKESDDKCEIIESIEEESQEDSEPKNMQLTLRKIYGSLNHIKQAAETKLQPSDKYSPKTWKFKIGCFNKALPAQSSANQFQEVQIAFPERLYHPYEAFIRPVFNPSFQEPILVKPEQPSSDKKRPRMEEPGTSDRVRQEFLSSVKKQKTEKDQPPRANTETPRKRQDNFESSERPYREGIYDSYKKYRAQVEERMYQPTIHCNYILNNPVIGNCMDLNRMASSHLGHGDLFMGQNAITHSSFEYRQPVNNYTTKYPNYEDPSSYQRSNSTAKKGSEIQYSVERGSSDRKKATQRTESPRGLMTPKLKTANKEKQSSYVTPFTKKNYERNNWKTGSEMTTGTNKIFTTNQKEKGPHARDISPYTPREMECLTLFKHFLKTPMTALSGKPPSMNKRSRGFSHINEEEEVKEGTIMMTESSRKTHNGERLLICSERMFQNQEFVQSIEDFLGGEMIAVDVSNDLDGIFYIDNKTCVVLIHDSEVGDDYQKTILVIIKILIKESLKSSNILVLFLLEEDTLNDSDLCNTRRKMFQALRALKVFFANFSCNLMFGFPCDMKQLLQYLQHFCIDQDQSVKKRKFSENAIKTMKKILDNHRRQTSKNVIFEMMWNSPCLNVIAVVEICFVIMEKNLTLEKLITLKKDQWAIMFGFLNDQQLV